MQTWCIYIDESGVSNEPQFIYAAICIPFNSQQEFLKSYSAIVNPLVGISGREIKYGHLLNTFDRHYRKEYKDKQFCASLVDGLFNAMDSRYPPIVELSEHQVVEGNPRREQALQLASVYDIELSTAYNIVDKRITLTEVLRRKQV